VTSGALVIAGAGLLTSLQGSAAPLTGFATGTGIHALGADVGADTSLISVGALVQAAKGPSGCPGVGTVFATAGATTTALGGGVGHVRELLRSGMPSDTIGGDGFGHAQWAVTLHPRLTGGVQLTNSLLVHELGSAATRFLDFSDGKETDLMVGGDTFCTPLSAASLSL